MSQFVNDYVKNNMKVSSRIKIRRSNKYSGPDVIECSNHSSWIETVSYYNKVLTVRPQNSNSMWSFYGVPAKVWQELSNAASVGSFLRNNIFGNLAYTSVKNEVSQKVVA